MSTDRKIHPKAGRPRKLTPAVLQEICSGLSAGRPLTLICADPGMPAARTVREWVAKDEAVASKIEDARAVGFDRIAAEILAIADEVTDKDTIETKFGSIPNKEWLMRSKLRVEARLKLLARWDPKRYGEKVSTEVSAELKTTPAISEEMQAKILEATAAAAKIAATVTPPASFRGMGSEE